MAIEKGHLEIAASLIETKGVDINANDNQGYAPLHIAILKGHTKVALALIEKGANIYNKCYGSNNSLHLAVEKDRLEIAQELLKHGSHSGNFVIAKNSSGDTPLHLAAKIDRLEIAQELLKVEGVNVNAKDSSGSTPLYAAIKAGNKEVIKALVSKGAKYSKLPIFDWQTISRGYTLRIVFYKIYNFSTGGEKNSNDSTAAPNNAAPRSSNEISRSGALVKPNESPNKD